LRGSPEGLRYRVSPAGLRSATGAALKGCATGMLRPNALSPPVAQAFRPARPKRRDQTRFSFQAPRRNNSALTNDSTEKATAIAQNTPEGPRPSGRASA